MIRQPSEFSYWVWCKMSWRRLNSQMCHLFPTLISEHLVSKSLPMSLSHSPLIRSLSSKWKILRQNYSLDHRLASVALVITAIIWAQVRYMHVRNGASHSATCKSSQQFWMAVKMVNRRSIGSSRTSISIVTTTSRRSRKSITICKCRTSPATHLLCRKVMAQLLPKALKNRLYQRS